MILKKTWEKKLETIVKKMKKPVTMRSDEYDPTENPGVQRIGKDASGNIKNHHQ